jgi:hypothetical protein
MRISACAGIMGIAGLGAIASLGLARPALAEDLLWDNAKQFGAVSVRDRPRTGFQPDGIRIGNYVMLPEIGFRTTVSHDAAGGSNDRARDMRYELSTGVEFRSDLPRHLLNFKIEGRAVTSQNRDDLRYFGGSAHIVGRLDIDHRTSLFGEASSELHRDEYIDEEIPKGARRPPGLVEWRGEAGLQHRMGRIDASIGARYMLYAYQDADSKDGSSIDQSARNSSLIESFATIGMRLSPGYRVFGEITGRKQENRGDDVFDRDAVGVKAMAGIEAELSPLVRLTLKGGYIQQDYVQTGLLDISTPVYDARIDWYVSPLVSLTFSARRDVHLTSYGAASGRITDAFSVRADYEMWRNLIVSGEVSFRHSDYVGEERTDQLWIGKIGVDYMLSKNWLLTLGYEHQELTSSVNSFDRKLDRVMIGAKYRF